MKNARIKSGTKLIPGQALIYTRANGVIYANYRDPPHNKIPKWNRIQYNMMYQYIM